MAQTPRRLSARWSRAREHGISRLNNERGDVLYEWGDGCKSNDGGMLHYHFGVGRMCRDYTLPDAPFRVEKSLLEDLEARGYDLTTFKFSIRKKRANEPPSVGAVDPHADSTGKLTTRA